MLLLPLVIMMVIVQQHQQLLGRRVGLHGSNLLVRDARTETKFGGHQHCQHHLTATAKQCTIDIYRLCLLCLLLISFLLLLFSSVNHFPPGGGAAAQLNDYDTVGDNGAIPALRLVKAPLNAANSDYTNQPTKQQQQQQQSRIIGGGQASSANRRKPKGPLKNRKKNFGKQLSQNGNDSNNNNNNNSNVSLTNGLSLALATSGAQLNKNASKDSFVDLQRMLELVRLEHGIGIESSNSSNSPNPHHPHHHHQQHLISHSTRPTLSLGQLNNIDSR